MTSERWQQVNDLFQLAAERAPEERTTFLQTACQGDEGLRREVESLIAYYERAENFIESPAFEVVPELLTDDRTGAIVGESIAHYRIESLIGVGGMGEVYLARDERLGRKVALKFLPERLTANNVQLSRFKSEARAASALNHPNILTVYEIGAEGNRHFIATEFIEGATLRATLVRGRMSVYDALEVAVQVASALAAAHKTGVVHRDIKPENIMIRPDGYVKVLDFGLAKLTEQKLASDNQDLTITNTQHTLAGMLVGTPRYMSPEQTRGQPADARSDIWSLGAVIYEMAGGIPAFSGATPSDCIASILKTEAPPLSRVAPAAPTELQSILHKALRKNRDERYQTIAEMLADLQSLKGKLERAASTPKIQPAWLWAAAVATIVLIGIGTLFFARYRSSPVAARSPISPATAQIPEKSIAVLPFENRSRDADNAYFADAIQDEILTRLSKIADLKVISRTSTQHYKTVPANIPDIAKQLGVAHILEGSVQKSGDAVRVNVQLIKAANDAHIWADTFDRKLTDILSVESDVAKAIADQLQAKLTGREEQVIAAKPTNNPEAYDAYLRGLAYSSKTANTSTNALGAQKYLKEAVRLDPKFALAWALLSHVEARGYITQFLQPTVALREDAQQAAERALTLQPNLGEAILAKGFYHYACLKDYDTAVRYFEQARPLLPNSSRIPELLAYVTRKQGQWERSESYFNEAERLDPRNVSLLTQHALSYKDRRLFPEALRKYEQILNITPDDVDTIVEKAVIAQAEGDLPRASTLLSSVQPAPDDTNALETQAYQAILERQPAQIISRLKEVLAKADPALGFYKGELRFWLGWTQDVVGDHDAARESWREARSELESFLKEQPENHILLGDLALTDMSLGDMAAALTLAEKGMAVNPIEKDAVTGPASIEFFARVAVQAGEADRAITALQKLLSTSYSGPLGPSAPLTPALLRLDPMFDPLRNDPRFAKIVEEAKEPVATTVPAKSIAVLPFENLSRDPDNAYFAEGVQDEILTRLSKIADLKVISRTSTQHYKSAPADVPEIAKQLGVAHVVEGSVQRAGNRVRVNAQLIDARNDAHLWAQTYDRDLADVFAIQSEIAKAIADQLQAKLSPNEKSEIEQPPTTDVTAFDFYSHAKTLLLNASGSSTGKPDLLQAADLLNQAVARDPSFFEAYCQLAFAHASLYFFDFDRTPSRLAAAEAAVQTAARLRPDAGETHLARARNLYWGHSDYDGALAELEIARQRLPSDSWVFSLKGYIERRQGRWEESLHDLERAIALDPRNILTLQQTARSYTLLHRYAESKSLFARVLSFEPNDPVTRVLHAFVELDSNANARPVHEVLDSIKRTNPTAMPHVSNNWLLCSLAERDAAAAKQALAACGENPILLSSNENVIFPRSFAEGVIARTNHDDDKARAAFNAAHAEQEKIVQAHANYGPALCVLGLIDAGLGRKEQALREGRRAVELVRAEKDALVGGTTIKYLAMIAAWVGETDLACDQLALLIRDPSGVSYGQLKLMPFWDPLRGDRRFEKIVEEAKEPVARELVATTVPAKSIAVLPFENLSRDPDNAYFAEGIQDEILTRLSKIADLKVISRTSTRQYKSAPANVPDIAMQLGVAFVVEGSVQKSGDAVRVNVQLIKAANDSHVWADTFDRKLTDPFSVESEVAKAIADQLGAKLSGKEQQVIAAKPTDNPEAYDAYLRGLAYSLKPANTTANSLGAQKYLREAVRLDPKFALAWALLSSVDSLGYLTKTLQPTVALREEARQAAETALSLQPNLGEAMLATGYYHYGCLKDYDTAIRHFEQAHQILPNDSRIPESLAYVTRRRGQWEQSETYFNEAERLDPRNPNLLTQHAVSLMKLRRLPEALRKLDQVLNITPDDVRTVAFKAGIAQAQGDLPRAAAFLAPLHPNADDAGTLETQVYQAIMERHPAAIIPRLTEILEKPDPELGYFNSDLRYWLGWAQDLAGDHVAAQKTWQQARSELEEFLKDQPDNFNVLTDLALTNMGLGDKAAALAFAERAIAANPIEKDATSGPSGIETLARVTAQMGEPDRAIAALRKLLSVPAVTDTVTPVTPALLRLDPMFDPLRNDSRFQELVAPAGIPKDFETPTQIPEKSIAVLPFENRSSDPENAFFTDGVQDEILTDLARVADLKVISRTSVMQYKTGAKRNLRQIGNELAVAHVVEGGVQRVGNRVRVNAQLIDARTDAHLWAQTYDRDLADVFAIQSEIAKAIADQLQAKLSPSEKSAIEQPPTTDITAFNLYSHAKNLFLTAFAGANGRADLLQAADLLKQAVARDPSFFQAYCQLAFTEINIYGIVDHSPEYLAQAEAALQSAARLRPDAGETHLARARNLYWGYLDYDGALRELEIARQTLPGEDWIFSLKGYIERRQGRWEECIRDLQRATELDPRNVLTLQQLALTYQQLRRYAEQKSTYERILAFEPNDPVTKSSHAFVELDSKADTRPLHQVTDSIRNKNPAALSSVADNWLLCAFAERDPAAAKEALTALGENSTSLGPIVDVRFGRSFMEGIIATMAKDDAGARAGFTAARAEQEKIVRAQPDYGPALCALGLMDAGLGRKDDALREGRRAVELLPVEKDASNGAAMIKYLAMIAAWVGDNDLAREQLAAAIHIPGSLSYGQLKLMPFWDPLRGHPRFEQLVEQAKQPVALGASASAVPGRGNITPAREKSIAVLPFENLSRDPDNAFFTDGVQEEILTDLARIADLKVISRTSVMQYKSRVKPNLRQVAKELGVAHVVEGSVQRAANRVRVNAQLIDARNDTHVWAQTYDRELTDIFAVESDIASSIADTLQAKLTGSERQAIASKPTKNPEAYQLYLRGRFFWNKRTAPDLRKAIDLLEEAVAKDPHYAQAYAAIAQSWLLLPAYEDSAPKDCFPKAQTAAEKALALDESLSDAHTALAAVKVLYNFDSLGSIAEFEQAIKLNPNDATAHHWLGNQPLTAVGDLDRALAEVRRAQELDPLSLVINTNVGWGLIIKGQYDEAVAQLRKTVEMDANFYYARYVLGQALQLSGHIAEAEKEYKKATELATDPVPLAYLAHLCGTNGRKKDARKVLGQLLEMRKQHYVDAYCLAIAYLGQGDRAEAMNWLDQGYHDRNGYELVSLRIDPFLAPLRGDPRFEALAEKIVPARQFKGAVASK